MFLFAVTPIETPINTDIESEYCWLNPPADAATTDRGWKSFRDRAAARVEPGAIPINALTLRTIVEP